MHGTWLTGTRATWTKEGETGKPLGIGRVLDVTRQMCPIFRPQVPVARWEKSRAGFFWPEIGTNEKANHSIQRKIPCGRTIFNIFCLSSESHDALHFRGGQMVEKQDLRTGPSLCLSFYRRGNILRICQIVRKTNQLQWKGTLLFEYFYRSLDEPATPRFLMNLHSAFLERTWRILESHSVFRALPVDTKCRIWSQNTNKASALFICRGEMSSSFVSMQHIVGDLDNATFMEE